MHDFTAAAPWAGDIAGFACTIEGGKLTARPERDFHDSEEARAQLDPALRSWELWLAFATSFPFGFGSMKLAWKTLHRE